MSCFKLIHLFLRRLHQRRKLCKVFSIVSCLLLIGDLLFLPVGLYFTFIESWWSSPPCYRLFDPQVDFTQEAQSTFDTVWINYARYHECVMSGRMWEGPADAKTHLRRYRPVQYIAFDSVNGLGNRIQGSTSALFYAMVTGRIFLLNWHPGDNHPAAYADMFNSSHLPHIDIPWSFTVRSTLQNVLSRVHARYTNDRELDKSGDSSTASADWSYYFREKLVCEPFMSYSSNENSKRVVVDHQGSIVDQLFDWLSHRFQWMVSDQYFAELLLLNPSIRSWAEKNMPDGQLFVRLGRQIFQPNNEVLDVLHRFTDRNSEYKRAYMGMFQQRGGTMEAAAHINMTVGFHMRTFKGTEGELDFFNCGQAVLKSASDAIKREFNKSSSAIPLTILILGDREMRVTRLKQIFQNHPPTQLLDNDITIKVRNIITKNQITDVDRVQSQNRNNDPCSSVIARQWWTGRFDKAELRKRGKECMQNTLAELISLSMNDYIIYTSHSTFGMVVGLWMNGSIDSIMSRIFIVGHGLDMDMKQSPLGEFCHRAGTLEPEYRHTFHIFDDRCRALVRL